MTGEIVTRFAPSPTGSLHPGNARTALFSCLLARRGEGRFLLRVEDTDRARDSELHLAAQLEDLDWLGLAWDAGPGCDDGRGPYRQSERGAVYASLYDALERAGRAYPCYCTPAELEATRRAQIAAGKPPRYAGTCRVLTAAARSAHAGEGAALRFAIEPRGPLRFDDLVRGPQSADPATIGDFVIRRADGAPVFFFCNAVDDALMGVTHVLRGDDHLSNTPRQLLLLEALALAAPRYGHLPLLLDPDGAPQSKRHGSVTLGELRRVGYLPAAVANYLLRLGHHGAPDAWVEPGELARHFDPDKLGRAPAHFDRVQLDHWQREAVLRQDEAAAARWLAPEFPPRWPEIRRVEAARVLRGNVLLPRDARAWLAVLDGDLGPLADDARQEIGEAGAAFFAAALDAHAAAGSDLRALARGIESRTGRRGAALYRPLRFALTGRHDGPELRELLAAIPDPLVRARLAAARDAAGR